jgi:serine/threonine-protein kinase RsbW
VTAPPILPGEPPRSGHVLLQRIAPSRLDLKQELLDAIAGVILSQGLVLEEDAPWLSLCLDEALVNAMLHGNEGDPDTAIDIEVRMNEERWMVLISDRGAGFDPEQIPDPEQPDSLLLEHGRGIRIMREWLDELTYYRGGATVFMARRRADRPRP